MKKIFSFLAALLFASSMLAANYVKTAYADIQTDDVVIITMQNANGVYAASNDQGTSNAPVATAVTVADDAITTDATNILWTVTKDGANITFKSGENALYCITSNNGVRVGSNANNVFSIDATSGYLFNNATNRYIGVYNSQDFRCYTSVNSNIQKQTLAFFVLSEGGEEPVAVKTKTIYCKVAQDWWKTDGAAVGAYAWKGEEKNAAWPGVRMTAVEGETDMWKIDLDLTKYESVIFTRVNGTGDIADWGAKSGDQTIPTDDKNLFTVTSTAAVWGDPGVAGEWSKYEASTGGEEPVVEPATADFTKAFTLKFNGTGTTADNSATFTVANGVAKVFDATSALYVKELTTVENVFAGRIIAEEASSLKFGTSSKKGTLAFALGQEIEVDSIIVNATQYGNTATEVTVNGTKFDLTAGNKVPTDCKITPEGKVSAITIAQTGSERIYLRYVTVYPKKQGGETPVVETADFYIAGTMTDWATNKIAVTGTSHKLNLEAGDHKLKVVVGEGEAAQWLGFSALTTIADGLTSDADGNICFTLAEAGKVNVHYDGEFFFLNGNFYVAPVEVKYYLKNNWDGGEWTWKEMTDLGDGTYMLYKVVVGGDGVNLNSAASDEGAQWITWADIETFDASFEPATIGALDTVVIYFDPEAVNSFMGANGMSAQILGKYVAPAEPEVKYYIVGSMTEWAVVADEAHAFTVNPENDAEYQLNFTLAENDAFKVVKVVGESQTWYPEGMDNNYTVDAAHAGEKTIYFRPDGQGGEGWHYGVIYVAANDVTPQPAAAVVLPATLDVTNVSFRSEGMPDFVIEEGQDYAGTYFDMGAHDSSNDTLLYAEWNVTIQPIKYNVAVDVYNTNSWSVQLYLLNQAGDTVKDLRYKGSYGKSGQFAIGSLDLSDLEAGDYKVIARAATAWSAMKLKDVIFTADYKGVSVELPGTLQPAYAELSSGASVASDAIAFKPSTVTDEYATWNVSFAKAGKYNVTIDITASNGHNYGVALLSADGTEEVAAVNEGGQKADTGVKELGAITVPAAGNYVVKLTNATPWSEAVLNSITFAAAAAEPEYYLVGSMTEWAVVADEAHTFAVNPENDAEYMLNFTLAENDAFKVVKVEGESQTWYPEGMENDYTVDAAHAGEKTIYFRPDGQGGEGWYSGVIYVDANEEPVVVELQAVSEATTWDFSKITANTENALYVSKNAGIQLTAESTPNKNEEVVYANYSADFMTFAEGFDATTMAFKGEYPIRKNQYCQAGTLHFKTTVAGTITVKFSDTGSNASATAVKRYLVVNGEQTEYWTSRENNGEEPYEAQLNVTSGEIAVPAGDVTVTGSSAIVMYNVTFTPKVEEPAKFYITGDSALVVNAGLEKAKAWNPDAIKSTETSYKLNLAAGDYKLKVTVDGTWETAKGFNDLTTTADGLTADGDGNICFTLTEAGEVNVHYDGEFFFLNGNFYVAPVEVKYYLKNNWEGGEWTWKEMTDLGDGTYMLYKVVVGGDGVNLNSAASDEGAQWITWADIETYDASYEPATIGALDTVVIYFDPEAVNSFTGANGMSAQILGKYVPGETPQPTEHTYTVAGSSEIAFGTTWDPANAANDMVKQEDGTYKWEKAELALAAGTVQFKVCEDHAWDVAYPASDYQLAIAEQGEYTITITFNPETKAVNAVATKTGDAVVTVNYYLAGSAKGWEAKAENIFTLNAEAGEGIEEYVIETTLEVGEGLKVLSSTGTWYPEGMGNEYVVDQNHAGATTIYFRPAYNAEWAAFGGYMYVVPTGTVGFDNTAVDAKAVKVLRDGQVIIIRGEHEYTTMGQMIK